MDLEEDLKQSVTTSSPPVHTGGKFVKGVSGNPAGRTKGSRNKITLQRLELEEALRGDLGKVGRKILKKAIAMALDGDVQMIKLLLDKTLSTLKNEDVGETRDTQIHVEIKNLTAVNNRAVDDVAPEIKATLVEHEVISLPRHPSTSPTEP